MLKIADYFNHHNINYDMDYVAESRAIKYSFVRHGYGVTLEATIKELENLDKSSRLVLDFIMDRCKICSVSFEGLSSGRPSF